MKTLFSIVSALILGAVFFINTSYSPIAIAAPNPLATYSFDASSGATLTDSSGNANHGTLMNGPVWTTGKNNNALLFDGSNDYVNLGNPASLNLTSSFTLSAWIYPQSLSGDRDIITKVGNGAHGYFLQTNGTELLVGFYNQGWYDLTTSGLGLSTNTWTHVTGVFDDTDNVFRIYVNGGLIGTQTVTASPSIVTSDVHIGFGWLGQNWNGRIDDTRIYNRALTQTEIQEDMNTPVEGGTPPPDTTPPTISITSPSNGSTLSGTVTILANATDDNFVAGVKFFADGALINSEDLSSPFSIGWDTQNVSNGQHVLTAVARDTSGNAATSSPIIVNTSNASLNDFINEIVLDNLSFVVTMEFLPDGKILLGGIDGTIYVAQPGASSPDPVPFIDIPNSVAFGDAGLLNITLDPNFSQNNYFYAFYAHSSGRDRLSRFTASPGWNSASAASEVVLWQDTSSTDPLHHGSDIIFGADGKIYFSTGDGGNPSDSQSLSSYHGKLLRINPDGTIPQDNPFVDGNGTNKDEVWAYGLRNPFRLSFDSISGLIYIADVGGNNNSTAIEEINIATPGANYGWPLCEGSCGQVSGITSPLFSYPHQGRDASITGGFVYRASQFPGEFYGSYFFADYAQNWIKRLTFNPDGTVASVVPFEPEDGSNDDPNVGDIVELKEGPDGSLYYLDLNFTQEQNFDAGGLRRIRYIGGGNQPPIASAAGNPVVGQAPLAVDFSSVGSIDPEGMPLSYFWDFGDNSSSTEANPSHTYQQTGLFEVILTISDGEEFGTDSLDITVGNPPEASILSPVNNNLFTGGDTIAIEGAASDAEDGDLPASAFNWNIVFHHEGHVHPSVTANGTKNFNFSIPTSGHDFSGSTSYEIILTVADSHGLEDSASVFIFPQKVNLNFDTVPSGLTVKLDGINMATPLARDTLVNFNHTIEAPNQTQGANSYEFTSWSDSGAQTHNLIVPQTDLNLVATFSTTTPPSIPNLFAQWKFNEGSGTVATDSSGNGRTGTLVNGPVWTTSGQLNGGLVFDGNNDYVNVGNLNVTGNAITMTTWIKFNSLPTNIDQRFISKANDSSESGHYWMFGHTYNGSNHRLRFRLKTGGVTNTLIASSGNLTTNTWYHAAAVYNGSTMKLYLNGTEVGSTAKSGSLSTSSSVNVNIGRNPGGSSNNFSGTMDDVRIYEKALTPQEISTVMNGG